MADMNKPEDGQAPQPPLLGSAADHRAAAESALQRRDYDLALRERFRATLRGLEQRGMLEIRRSRTAAETADDVTIAAVPVEHADEFRPAAHSFDEVVYGGRRATEDEYRRLEFVDQFSAAAPPPVAGPREVEAAERKVRTRRTLPPLPDLLRDPKFWATLAAIAALVLLLWAVLQSCGAPDAPPPPELPPPVRPEPDLPDDVDPDFGTGSDSIFERLPAPVAFGGLQFLIAGALLVWWRARRRGALVGEPRPVEVTANELLAGQAALYRRSGDHEYVAAKLRAATLRRVRSALGVTADTAPEQVVAAVTARTGADSNWVHAALYGPVPDEPTLEMVAAQLEWIEAEVS
ncbi:DUF4129 domain-containing protein [Nocardia cyriacigeorgica]|uniref:DUF4129 domain-containing protein n=2 Tax=Nocardia cyriacigeorgica TaxID=135487 RepID=A0A6P1D8A4_9NOCA|nr:DUF4129 domain-containing protein [Nocardia cyriacigeorgica]NEW49281.1 DUF4129 domain-containing protein [Nocardia cyriacigeorgica]NEW54232.1 DUF4129 domain-containing protein [Nocardia cyriacigeorgica]